MGMDSPSENSQSLCNRSLSVGLEIITTHVEETTPTTTKPQKNLTDEQRVAVYQFLLKESNDGKLKHGSVSSAAKLFSASPRTVSRIWKRSKECQELSLPVDVSSRMPKKVGRKRTEIDITKIHEIPLERCKSIRSIAEALNVTKSTLQRRMKEGAIAVPRPHLNAVEQQIMD
ncbi:hypothetical protein MKW94_015575 [Papaver nudicaule]|uniref:DUF7769 domain-containing protein n=1 Tax=Papaver nudicaule TaxID=74823 RepID=A0AA42AYF7_PAPNU|nr:hypothetical protein [Papaver nudicaule]